MESTMQKIENTVSAFYDMNRYPPILTYPEWESATLAQQEQACSVGALIKLEGCITYYRIMHSKRPRYSTTKYIQDVPYFKVAMTPADQLVMGGRKNFVLIGRAHNWDNHSGINFLDITLEQAQSAVTLAESVYNGVYYVSVLNQRIALIPELSSEFVKVELTQEVWNEFLLSYTASVAKISGGLNANVNPRSIFHI